MTDYIKREDAYRRLTEYYHHTRDIQHDSLRIALFGIPSADVAPVRHGRWKEQQKKYRIYSCSECNKVTLFEKWGDTVMPYDYCPNCGARMDAKE